jgi:limonene-1,2-epoxide hydrolase
VKAWEDLDLEAIIGGFAPDAVYHNSPTDPVIGHDQIRATIQPWIAASAEMKWVLHNIAETPSGVVMAERTTTWS